jgi:hypothetical protein
VAELKSGHDATLEIDSISAKVLVKKQVQQ